MSDVRQCPQCGAALPVDAPQGLCPKCLLQLGFESQYGPASRVGAGPTVYQPRFVPPTVEELAARFPQLEILEEIGHGGMGVVYKARQKDLDRVVALKILRPDLLHDAAFAERFVREARALGKLSHPAIVTVYDFGRSDGLFYLVMEYVEGANLRQLERTGRLTPPEALRIVPAICEALQYAHDQGVVHRDIKPENILIDKDGRVKIADFGLAKIVGAAADAAALTGAWHVMGTPHYMAPEQMQGAHAVDHRADIYSLGVVIYEMLTGELPVGRFPLPSQKVQVDVRLDDVVLRALEREPQRRYQRVTEIKTDVETVSRSAAAGGRAREQGPAAAVPAGGEPTIPAALRHAFGFWSRPQPGYDRRVGWPVMGLLALWVILLLTLIGLNLMGAPIGERTLNAVLVSGIAGIPLTLIVLTLLYLARGRGSDVPTPAVASSPGDSGRSAASTESKSKGTPQADHDQLRAELMIPSIGLLVTGGLELTAAIVLIVLYGLHVFGVGPGELSILAGPSLLLGLVTVATALRLRSLRNYRAAVAGCIVCAVPLSFGWWMRIAFVALAMFTLRRPEVRHTFDSPASTDGHDSHASDARWLWGTILLLLALWLSCVFALRGVWGDGPASFREGLAIPLYAGLFALPPVILLFLIVRFAIESPHSGFHVAPATAPSAGHSTRAAEPASATQAPGSALVAVGVMEWIACWLSCLILAVVALNPDRDWPAVMPDRGTLQFLLPIVALLGAVLSAVVILAGLKMKRLESRRFAIAGSILAMFVSPGNVIGLPIGLWALYVLTRPQVRALFCSRDDRSAERVSERRVPEHISPSSLKSPDGPALGLVLAGVLYWVASLQSAFFLLWGSQVTAPRPSQWWLLGFMPALIGTALILGGVSMRRRGFYAFAFFTAALPVVVMLVRVSVLGKLPPITKEELIAIPIGIWALSALIRPEVRAAFRG